MSLPRALPAQAAFSVPSRVSRGSLYRGSGQPNMQRLQTWYDFQGVAAVARNNSLLSSSVRQAPPDQHDKCNAPPIGRLARHQSPFTFHLSLLTFHFSLLTSQTFQLS
jgi:hypothetical protein